MKAFSMFSVTMGELVKFSYHFSAPILLEKPFDGGLRGPGLALQKRAAALHPELHRLPETLLNWDGERALLLLLH